MPTPVWNLRVEPAQLERWKAAARRSGQPLSQWAREALDLAAGVVPTPKSEPELEPVEPAVPENALTRATRLRREWEELLRDHRAVALSEFGSLEEYERRTA
jgi:hypothetical protein